MSECLSPSLNTTDLSFNHIFNRNLTCISNNLSLALKRASKKREFGCVHISYVIMTLYMHLDYRRVYIEGSRVTVDCSPLVSVLSGEQCRLFQGTDCLQTR